MTFLYSYRVYDHVKDMYKDMHVEETQVRATGPMRKEWGYFEHIPRSFDKGAMYHHVDAVPATDNDPAGLIECSDGSVFTYEDVVGAMDPEESPFVGIPDPDPPGTVIESDFFKRQLEGIDKQIYAAKYPAKVTSLLAPGWVPKKRTRRERLRAWVSALRYRLGMWIAGMPLGDDEDL